MQPHACPPLPPSCMAQLPARPPLYPGQRRGRRGVLQRGRSAGELESSTPSHPPPPPPHSSSCRFGACRSAALPRLHPPILPLHMPAGAGVCQRGGQGHRRRQHHHSARSGARLPGAASAALRCGHAGGEGGCRVWGDLSAVQAVAACEHGLDVQACVCGNSVFVQHPPPGPALHRHPHANRAACSRRRAPARPLACLPALVSRWGRVGRERCFGRMAGRLGGWALAGRLGVGASASTAAWSAAACQQGLRPDDWARSPLANHSSSIPQVVDTTGAGDLFAGGWVARLGRRGRGGSVRRAGAGQARPGACVAERPPPFR